MDESNCFGSHWTSSFQKLVILLPNQIRGCFSDSSRIRHAAPHASNQAGKASCVAGDCLCRLLDKSDNRLGLRDKGHMACIDLTRSCAHAPGVEALHVWMKGLILCRHEIPRGDALPRCGYSRLTKDRTGGRLLRRRHHTRLGAIDISSKYLAELRSINVDKTRCIGHKGSAKRGRRELVEQCANRLASVRRKGG